MFELPTDPEGSIGEVAVAIISPGHVRAELMTTLIQVILNQKSRVNSLIFRQSGPLIDAARNRICEEFLQLEDEWLWFVDSDMVLEQDTLEKLLAVADPKTHPIVGALCFGRDAEGIIFPTMYRLADTEGTFQRAETVPEEGLVEVDATGAACLLIHRDALKTIGDRQQAPFKWFQETQIKDALVGEDVTFCFRARDAGYPIYVDCSNRIGHVKDVLLDMAAHKEFKRTHRFLVTSALPDDIEKVGSLISNVGVRVGHEEAFPYDAQRYNWDGAYGEASWYAFPFLQRIFDKRVRMLQVVRHPLTAIPAIVESQVLEQDLIQDFIAQHADWPKEIQGDTPLERAANFYLIYNLHAEKYSKYRFRVEDIDKPLIEAIFLAIERKREDSAIENALANYTPLEISPITWNDIPESVDVVSLREMAERFGYLEE